MTIARNKELQDSTNEQIADWVSKELYLCGFPTQPLGSKWGVLIEEDELPTTSLRKSDFTFLNETDLFNNEVIMVLRNKDKKHIISIDDNHKTHMRSMGFNPTIPTHILAYLQREKYL